MNTSVTTDSVRLVRNYRRFYALLSDMPVECVSREELKEQLVHQYSGGRTVHLRELTEAEYRTLMADMERLTGDVERRERYRAELRRLRAQVLHQMQVWGVDTSDWNRVDAFCEDPRIAGKKFRFLSTGELEELSVKMRVIQRKKNCRLN
jgi:hypothetical protein